MLRLQILLLEGGGRNDDPALHSADQKWSIAFTDALLNWGYMSTPENQLLGQRVPCVRGRGLGGSTSTILHSPRNSRRICGYCFPLRIP